MNFEHLAAALYCAATFFVVAFQIALAAGAPWGSYAMGGRHPGVFPPALRVAAVLQAVLLVALALIVGGRVAWVPTNSWAPELIWIPVGVSVVSLVMNSITPSADERRLWAPVALVMCASSLGVALS